VSARPPTSATRGPIVVVAAHNEADRLGPTLAALSDSLPGSELIVADDASADATAEVARAHGARVVSTSRSRGKGANVGNAVETVLHRAREDAVVFLLCDGDLGASAAELERLVAAVSGGESDLAVAAFTRRVGGGFGVALGFSRWAIRRRCGAEPIAPLSGQRALTGEVLRAVYPFAPGYGMETAMTIDAVRAGYRLREYELDLEHRATGPTPRGFAHRARQLLDIARAYVSRRRSG
jgi:glycosyltransferase involved in cell wall biosynthesis